VAFRSRARSFVARKRIWSTFNAGRSRTVTALRRYYKSRLLSPPGHYLWYYKETNFASFRIKLFFFLATLSNNLIYFLTDDISLSFFFFLFWFKQSRMRFMIISIPEDPNACVCLAVACITLVKHYNSAATIMLLL